MKSIKDLREQYNLITEKEEHDMNKLTQLVRAGLFDAKKMSALKRAMEKPADKMTAQEKRMMINLLDALMSEVLSDKMVYRKIKQDVMMKESKAGVAKDVPNIPAVVLLKRKAIRAFPDGQKVGLYYAQALDKYVTIPFNEIGVGDVNEEIRLGEGIIDTIKKFANTYSSNTESSSTGSKKEPKYYDSMSSKLTIAGVAPKSSVNPDDDMSPAVRAKMRSQYRQSLQVQEEVINEDIKKREAWDREGNEGARVPRGGGSNPAQVPYGGINPRRTGSGELASGRKISSGALRRSKSGTTLRNPLARSPVKTMKKVKQDVQADVKQKQNQEYGKNVWKKQAEKKQVDMANPKPSGPPKRIVPKRKSPDRREDPFDDPRTRPGTPVRKDPNKKPEPRRNEPDKKSDKKPDKRTDPASQTRTGKDAKTDLGGRRGLGRLGRLALLAGLARGGGPEKSKGEKKIYEPGKFKFGAEVVAPKDMENDAAIKSQERKLFRQAMAENVQLNLDGNLFEINSKEADKVLGLYESLNAKNKKKMVQMMNESNESLKKVISFAIRQ